MSAATGKRALIVEDESLVAMLIEDLLLDLGHSVVGIGGRLDAALKLAQESELDFAIVDLNLNGKDTYPIAEALRERSVPFVFATGYGAAGVREGWESVPVLQKPFEPHQLEAAITRILR